MRVASIRRAVAAGSAAIIVVAHVYAQETTGTIIGSLIDQTAAVLPGVRVVIKSADTGQTR